MLIVYGCSAAVRPEFEIGVAPLELIKCRVNTIGSLSYRVLNGRRF